MDILSIKKYLKSTYLEPTEENPNPTNIDAENTIVEDSGNGQYKITVANTEQISLIKAQFDRDSEHLITINKIELQSSIIQEEENSIIVELITP